MSKRYKTVTLNTKDLKLSGYRWPDFSPEFKQKWKDTMLEFLGKNTANQKLVDWLVETANYRRDVEFWQEMRNCGAVPLAYTALGGDAVPDLFKDLINVLCAQPDAKPEMVKLINQMRNDDRLIHIITLALMDMNEQIGGDSFAWAKEIEASLTS